MQDISGERAKRILEGAYNWLKEIDPAEMTTFELNLWRELRETQEKLPEAGCEQKFIRSLQVRD